ncbi:hypothetical protein BGX23_001968 [Mortierella sp. AD031]|nr:hypothetical protein BGX23_001968 [Mortierella sp. AD031]
MLVLARHIQHVRALGISTYELIYYYHCVHALEEIIPETMRVPVPRPAWLLSSNIRVCQVAPLPPMTCLSELAVDLGDINYRRHALPTAGDAREVSTGPEQAREGCRGGSWKAGIFGQSGEPEDRGIDDWFSILVADIRSILAHFPNLKKLDVPAIRSRHDVNAVEEFLSKECSKVKALHYGSLRPKPNMYISLPFETMHSLPAQQLTDLTSEYHQDLCPYHLLVPQPGEPYYQQTWPGKRHCIALEDVLESPWRCIKLRRLGLSISGCELPVEPGLRPYYSRPAPITLTEAETQHFAQLERLYRQIGLLTELRSFELNMVKLDGEGVFDRTSWNKATLFPGMLSLDDTRAGRPGYLGHLSGLKKLESLAGSVRADTVEGRATMEWKEIVWMHEHWSRLEFAHNFFAKKNVRPAFEWLKNQCKDGRRVELWLGLKVCARVG